MNEISKEAMVLLRRVSHDLFVSGDHNDVKQLNEVLNSLTVVDLRIEVAMEAQ